MTTYACTLLDDIGYYVASTEGEKVNLIKELIHKMHINLVNILELTE